MPHQDPRQALIDMAGVRSMRRVMFGSLAALTLALLSVGNDFRGDRCLDCIDSSSGEGTAGTSNTWINKPGP